MPNSTPLRYPGGKARLRPYIERLIATNSLYDAHYAEPFCGGAGLAIELLQGCVVSTVHLNDYDPAVYAFWHSAVKDASALCGLISDTPCNIETWHEQKEIYRNRTKSTLLQLGFATFFLNRTNRSGILEAGVIGGKNQSGVWKLDARYNKADLINRIRAIAALRSRIKVYNLEAKDFLERMQTVLPKKSLVYLDPPYVEKGPGLYLNSYTEQDHRALAVAVQNDLTVPWIVSYDDHPLIHECYGKQNQAGLNFPYSAYGNARRGNEVMFFSEQLVPPDMEGRSYRYHQPWQPFSANAA